MTHDEQLESYGLTRRILLKAAGAATTLGVSAGAFAGTALAGDLPDDIYWCNCESVKATGFLKDSFDKLEVVVYNGGFTYVEIPKSDFKSMNGKYYFEYEVSNSQSLIAFRVMVDSAWRYYPNPSECAEEPLETYVEERGPVTLGGIEGESKNVCGKLCPPPEDVWFCGCSQVSAYCPENDNGGHGYTLVLKKEGSSDLHTMFVATDSDGLVNKEVSEPYGIVGLKTSEGVIRNPNNCAVRWHSAVEGDYETLEFDLEHIWTAACGSRKKVKNAADGPGPERGRRRGRGRGRGR